MAVESSHEIEADMTRGLGQSNHLSMTIAGPQHDFIFSYFHV